MAYLTLAAMLVLVLFPLLIPVVLHGSHAVAAVWRRPPRFSTVDRRHQPATKQAA